MLTDEEIDEIRIRLIEMFEDYCDINELEEAVDERIWQLNNEKDKWVYNEDLMIVLHDVIEDQLDVDYGCDLDRFQHECSDGGAQSIANKLGECVIYDSTDNRYYTETEYHELMIKGASMSGDVFTDEEWEQFKEDESKESVNTWYYPQK